MNNYPLVRRGLLPRSRRLLSPLEWACLVALTFFATSASPARAQIAWDESANGDLSNSGLTPTVLTLKSGSNWILGTTGRVAAGTDRDYFTFTVPAGFVFSHLVELPGTNIGGLFSFIGVQMGNEVTIPTTAVDATGLLGWTHYDNSMIGSDLFPLLQTPNMGSSGFSGALEPGSYSFWVQDFNAGSITYAFDAELTPVPEPSTYAAAGGALLLALVIRRRLKKGALKPTV